MLCSAPFPSDVLLMLLLCECIVLVYEAWLVWVMEVVLCPFNITIVSLHALVQWSAFPPPLSPLPAPHLSYVPVVILGMYPACCCCCSPCGKAIPCIALASFMASFLALIDRFMAVLGVPLVIPCHNQSTSCPSLCCPYGHCIRASVYNSSILCRTM